MALTYEIHAQAKWDNGTSVTGYDYLFTVKVAKHQNISSSKHSSLEFIKAIEVDPVNPQN